MTSAYVPEESAGDSMSDRERLIRVLLMLLVATVGAALLIY